MLKNVFFFNLSCPLLNKNVSNQELKQLHILDVTTGADERALVDQSFEDMQRIVYKFPTALNVFDLTSSTKNTNLFYERMCNNLFLLGKFLYNISSFSYLVSIVSEAFKIEN